MSYDFFMSLKINIGKTVSSLTSGKSSVSLNDTKEGKTKRYDIEIKRDIILDIIICNYLYTCQLLSLLLRQIQRQNVRIEEALTISRK